MARIVYIVTVSLTGQKLLRGQLAYFREQGHDVHLIAGDDKYLAEIRKTEGITVHQVAMEREIAPAADWRSLKALKAKLAELSPDLVSASTPKAGLLGMMAARRLGIKGRIYVLRGLRLETLSGWKARISALAERKASACAHVVVCVSPSLRSTVVRRGLVPEPKAVVIGQGSSNGVLVERFVPSEERLEAARSLRSRLGIPEDAVVVGFVGRFTKDKGMVEMMDAFQNARLQNPRLALLLVGDYEPGDPVPEATRTAIESAPGVYRAGFLEDTAPAYLAMSALCLPTYREGFPNVPIEAAAAMRPCIASDATGAVDAVVDGETGWIVPVRNSQALCEAFLALASDPSKSQKYGRAAHERALTVFPPLQIWQGLGALYEKLLKT